MIDDAKPNNKTAMPLSMLGPGEQGVIDNIGWGYRLKKRLEDMGLVPGVKIKIISSQERGALIVCVKDSRLVLGRGMAHKILVVPVN
ncbi:MAG: FeoA family protein [Clostridia bacterium]|nr:FeoA family protein [Clostridia bacterium]